MEMLSGNELKSDYENLQNKIFTQIFKTKK